jgi:type II secretory pathway pseudopilin PulG
LFELLLVLAILVVVAAMAVPLLQRSFLTQKVNSAADRVRAECGKARVRAIRESEVYAFYYAPGSNHYAVAPFKDAAKYVNAQMLQTGDRDVEHDLQANVLPRGVRFAGVGIVSDGRSDFASAQGGTGLSGMQPILFYPDGKCQSAQITLQSIDTGETITIKLRDLTGTSTIVKLDPDSNQ